MTEECGVFRVGPSVEDDRPQIKFDSPAIRAIDWERLDAILRGERPTTDYQELRIGVRGADAAAWGYYSIPGTLGLISELAVQCIGRSAFAAFELLPARLNGTVYFLPRIAQVLRCLDLASADVVRFRTDPERIKDITRYAFLKEMIVDPLVFSIPELPGLFATSGVVQALKRERVPGFQFTPVG